MSNPNDPGWRNPYKQYLDVLAGPGLAPHEGEMIFDGFRPYPPGTGAFGLSNDPLRPIPGSWRDGGNGYCNFPSEDGPIYAQALAAFGPCGLEIVQAPFGKGLPGDWSLRVTDLDQLQKRTMPQFWKLLEQFRSQRKGEQMVDFERLTRDGVRDIDREELTDTFSELRRKIDEGVGYTFSGISSEMIREMVEKIQRARSAPKLTIKPTQVLAYGMRLSDLAGIEARAPDTRIGYVRSSCGLTEVKRFPSFPVPQGFDHRLGLAQWQDLD